MIPGECDITERLLKECLDGVLAQSKDNPERRLKIAAKSDAWNLMGKHWKGFLSSILRQDIESAAGSAKGRRRVGRRGGRAQRALMARDELEPLESVLDGDGQAAYRLAVLLIHKMRMGDGWNLAWNTKVVELREDCEESGVHPVYNTLGHAFESTLGEMVRYPIKDVEKRSVDAAWLGSCRIDPHNPNSITVLLKPPLGLPLSAKIESDLNRLHTQSNGRGGIRQRWLIGTGLNTTLSDLGREHALLGAILAEAAGMKEARKLFESLAEGDDELSKVASLHLMLLRFRSGDNSVWRECIELPSEDTLSLTCRVEAWSNIPNDIDSFTSESLIDGLETLSNWSEISGQQVDLSELSWRLVAALLNEGLDEDAAERCTSLEVSEDLHLRATMGLLESGHREMALSILKQVVEKGLNIDYSPLINSAEAPTELRIKADELMSTTSGIDAILESKLQLYATAGDVEQLAQLLSECEHGAWPNHTLVVSRLLPASSPADLLTWAVEARKHALSVLTDDENPAHLSPLTMALTTILNGGLADLEQIQSRLSTEGILAFRQCRRAMMEGGDGLVSDQQLEHLRESIQKADLEPLEAGLFEQLILHLQLNRADSLLQQDEKKAREEAEAIVENVLNTSQPTLIILEDIREQVLEHGVASPALLAWHRANEPQSMWAAIAAARISEREDASLDAARSYRSAAVRCDDYELRQKLNKRSLISFAHAGNWPEAIELLESEAGLAANITNRFSLYLKVNDEAGRQRLDQARDLILSSVRDIQEVEFKNDDGESESRIEESHSMEDLNLLLTYPALLKLPGEPFRGRVLAAINSLRTGRNRRSTELEGALQRALHSRKVTDVYEAANRAEEERGPEHGLLFYERAMNSGSFSPDGMKNLSEMQTAMYARNEHKIPVRQRMHLTNLALKPLVVLDTNLLIDALADRVLRLLEVERETPMHIGGRREFHRTILFREEQGRIDVHVPAVVQKELRNFSKDTGRVRDLCGDRLLDRKEWDKHINEKVLAVLVEQLIEEYDTWTPPMNEENGDMVQSHRDNLKMFFITHSNVYRDINKAKKGRRSAASKRTQLKGLKIYPERGDIDIMLLAAHLANENLTGFGSVLVASRDSDFTVPARAFQEKFGFAVVDNANSMARWTRYI